MNAAPVTALAFGFESVMVSTLGSLVATEPGAKAFATVSPSDTESVALAAAVLAPAFAVVSPPAATVFT